MRVNLAGFFVAKLEQSPEYDNVNPFFIKIIKSNGYKNCRCALTGLCV